MCSKSAINAHQTQVQLYGEVDTSTGVHEKEELNDGWILVKGKHRRRNALSTVAWTSFVAADKAKYEHNTCEEICEDLVHEKRRIEGKRERKKKDKPDKYKRRKTRKERIAHSSVTSTVTSMFKIYFVAIFFFFVFSVMFFEPASQIGGYTDFAHHIGNGGMFSTTTYEYYFEVEDVLYLLCVFCGLLCVCTYFLRIACTVCDFIYGITLRTGWRRSRRSFFASADVTKENIELVVKIMICTDWRTPVKASAGLLSIVQVFRPQTVIYPHLVRLVSNIVDSPMYSAQSSTIQEMVDCYAVWHAQSGADDEKNSLRDDVSRYWNKVSNSDIGRGMSQLAIILVTTGLIPEIDWKLSGIEIFSLRKAGEIVKAKDVFSAGQMIMTSVMNGVAHYETSRSFEGFFSSNSLESQVSHALSLYQQVLIGNLSSFSEYTNESYISRLEELKSKVEKRMRNPNSSDKFFFKSYLDKINDTLSSMAVIQMEQQTQVQAFGLLFHGNSSVGKSWIAPQLIEWLLRINNFSHAPANIITYNTNSKYDDQVRNNTYGILLDDLANGKVGKGGADTRRTSDLVIALINNVAQPAVKADIAEKGKVLMKPKVVVATTNNRDLNANVESHNEASVRRRFKYEVEFRVKPEFCIEGGSSEIDVEKVKEKYAGHPFPDVWDLMVTKCMITSKTTGDGKGFTHKPVLSPSGNEAMSMFEFLEFCKVESALHFAREESGLKTRSNASGMICEKCCMPGGYHKPGCETGVRTAKAHADFVSEMGQQFVSVGRDRYQELEDARALLASSPRVHMMLLAQSSLRNFVVFHVLPDSVLRIWLWCDGRINVFVACLLLPTLGVSYILALLPYMVAKVLSFAWLICMLQFIKDVSFHAITETIIANSASSRARNAWRFLIQEHGMKRLMKRLAMYGSGIMLLLFIVRASSVSLNGHSIEASDVDDAREKIREKGVWSFFRGIKGNTAGGITLNMTTKELTNRIAGNLCYVTMRRDGKRYTVRGFFVAKGYLVLPYHFLVDAGDVFELELLRSSGRRENVVVDMKETDGEKQFAKVSADLLMLRLTGVNGCKDIVNLFSKRARKDGIASGVMVQREEDGSIVKHRIDNGKYQSFRYRLGGRRYNGEGIIANCEEIPEQGMCGTLVVSNEIKPEIVGCHIAGYDGSHEACSLQVTQDMLRKAIEELDATCVFKYIHQDEANEFHANSCCTKEIHRFCPTKHANDIPLDVIGSVPGTGPRKMFTRKTPYHEEVCEHWQIQDPYGIPKATAKIVDGELKSPWKNAIDEFRMTRNKMPYSLLVRAKNEIVSELVQKIDLHIQAGGVTRPLTIDEVVNGIPGVRGIDGQKMNTAAGIRYGKKKKDHLVSEDYPYRYKSYVVEDVEKLHHQLSNNVRAVNTLNSNLKDEPLKKEKVENYRTRVFFSDELHYMIVLSQLYTPVMAYLMCYPETAHSAIGLNAESHDWECVWNYLLRKGEEIEACSNDGVAFDFKAFDKTLPENLMKMSWEVMVQIACRMPGYTEADIVKMRVIADEKTTPYIRFNGTLMQCNFSHTSGNGCTATVGSIAGLMMLCMSYYAIEDPYNMRELKALDVIRSIHLGDDGASTVINKDKHGFNFVTLQAALRDWGVTITPPDKESAATEFQDLEHEDFLKRHFVWCPLRESMVGRLAKKSLFKSLLYFLPSQVEVENVQLGQSIGSVLKEASLHGREVFAEFKCFAEKVSAEHGLPITHIDRTIDDYVVEWAYDSGKRHMEYRARKKPHLEGLAIAGKIAEHKQQMIFGRVIKKCEEPAAGSEYTAHAEVVHIDNVEVEIRCCRGSRCCARNRRGEEDFENTLTSSGSGSRMKANTGDVVENDGEAIVPTSIAETPSTSDARVTSRVKLQCCIVMIIICGLKRQVEALGAFEFDPLIERKELTSQQQETMMFKFNDQGWMSGRNTVTEESATSASHYDMQLGNFLSRPVKIGQTVWTESSITSPSEINPWSEFLRSPTVTRKIDNFKLLRGTLKVKFVINGSPFLYGKLMCVYNPLHNKDDFRPANVPDRTCRLSQREHIYLNPTTSSGGELCLPFFWQHNAVSIPDAEWDQLGSITMLPISALKHAAGESASCVVTMFAWMDNVSLMQPTSTVREYTAQSSEKEEKVVSKTLSAVGNVAESLSKVPWVGPYARATAQVSGSLGKMADIFGFSKPRMPYEGSSHVLRHSSNLATTNGKDASVPLAMDENNEVTIDPRTVGLEGQDEMSIPYVCSKEALITRFTWRTTDGPDTELLRIPVTPYIGATFPNDGLIDMPPCAYVATFFKYWRGTVQYRFMINASSFHRGKLRFRFEPYAVAGGQDYNVVQSEILDLSEVHDHKVEIGWGADRNFLEVSPNGRVPTYPNDNVDLRGHNGVLVVSVANTLTVPDEASEDAIEILVGVNMHDDVQFSVPTGDIINRMPMVADTTTVDVPVVPDPELNVYPQPNDPGSTTAVAFYYGWHTNDFHDSQGYVRDKLTTVDGQPNKQFPEVPGLPPGEYSDDNRTTVRAQFDLMLNAGINNVCCSWWGPGSREDVQFRDNVLAEAGSVAAGNMSACILYEMGRLRVNGAYVATSSMLDTLAAEIAYIKTEYANNPKYLRYSHADLVAYPESGPVIFLYLLRAYSDTDKQRILDRIFDVFLDNSIGGYTVAPHIVGDLMFGTPRQFNFELQQKLGSMGVYDVYGQGPKGKISEKDVQDLHANFREWQRLNPNTLMSPTVSPGYNDRGVRLQNNHPALSRALDGYDEGSLLKAHLTQLNEDGDGGMAFINSWNEWHEDTQIEPCGGAPTTEHPVELTNGLRYEPYGTKYLNILGEYFRDDYVAQSAAVDEPSTCYVSGETQKPLARWLYEKLRDCLFPGERDFVAHSSEERENEHAPETQAQTTILEKPVTYHNDDLIFFGETVGSLRAMIKRYGQYRNATPVTEGFRRNLFPAFPHYDWENPDSEIRDTVLTRIASLFLGRRGSMRWKLFADYSSKNNAVQTLALTDAREYQFDRSENEEWVFANAWNGLHAITGKYNPVLEIEAPYYSNKRFHISRTLARDEDVYLKHVYDGENIARIHSLCAAGDDMQFFYFAGTPSVQMS